MLVPSTRDTSKKVMDEWAGVSKSRPEDLKSKGDENRMSSAGINLLKACP